MLQRATHPRLIQVRVSEELREKLHAIANSEDLPMAAWLRKLCRSAVRQHEQQQSTPTVTP